MKSRSLPIRREFRLSAEGTECKGPLADLEPVEPAIRVALLWTVGASAPERIVVPVVLDEVTVVLHDAIATMEVALVTCRGSQI